MAQNNLLGGTRAKGDFKDHLKAVHDFRLQLKPLRFYLNGLLELIPHYHEPGVRQGLLDHIENVVINHGRTGLKHHKNLFIQGVKVLGGDETTDFTGFKLSKDGFPKYYSGLFKTLSNARTTSIRDVAMRELPPQGSITNTSVIVTKSVPVMDIPNSEQIYVIKLALSILRWPYSIRLPLSKQDTDDLLNQFHDEIQVNTLPKYAHMAEDFVYNNLVTHFDLPDSCFEPLTFIPSNRTYKGGRPSLSKDRRIPYRTLLACYDRPSTAFSYDGPVGKASVLSEKAGKTRIITSYDGAINSSNLYDKARDLLDIIPEDCSDNQQRGHQHLVDVTGRSFEKGKTKVTSHHGIISADLSAFTDNLNIGIIMSVLRVLNASDFSIVISSPILVSGKVVHPTKALMGLKGTFELASLAHHGLVRAMLGSNIPLRDRVVRSEKNYFLRTTTDIYDYSMCGDDLLFYTDNMKVSFEKYEQLVRAAGLVVNKAKTVLSPDTAVFCGRVSFRGCDVTPVVPPLYSFVVTRDQFIQSAGSFIESSKGVGKPFKRMAVRLVKSIGRLYRGKFIPYNLPKKLGGIGVDSSIGLIAILSLVRNRQFVRFKKEREPPPEVISVSYPVRDINLVPLFPFTPNLAVKGFTKRFRGRVKQESCNNGLKSVYECLEYYYS